MDNNIFKKDDIADLLHQKTGFYKKNMLVVVNALEEIIFECLQSATFEQDSEVRLAPGVLICGNRRGPKETKNPKTGETVMSPERVVPYAVFKQSVRQKLYNKPKINKKKAKKG